MVPIVGYWSGTVALSIFFFFTSPSSCIEHISISGHYSEINRQSMAHGCPSFAYSFVFLMLRQYYWHCDSFAANRRSSANKQKSAENNLLALQMCLVLPIGVESAPHFTYKCRAHRSAINISCDIYIAQILLGYVARTTSPTFSELAYNLGSTNRKQKYGKIKMKPK